MLFLGFLIESEIQGGAFRVPKNCRLVLQIDQRSGVWQCYFCKQSSSDASSLSLLDSHVRPLSMELI